jgi:hypothetical protein
VNDEPLIGRQLSADDFLKCPTMRSVQAADVDLQVLFHMMILPHRRESATSHAAAVSPKTAVYCHETPICTVGRFRLAETKILLRYAISPATLRSMKRISSTLRRRIDAVAAEVADIANTLKPDFPELAAVYSSFSRAIDASHYSFRGTHQMSIDIPKSCRANIVNCRNEYGRQEHFVFLSVPHQEPKQVPQDEKQS